MYRLLLLALIVYALIVALSWAFQERLLYLPQVPGRDLVASPADRGWRHESVALEAADGTRLHGWWLPVAEARAGLIFFHGNAGNISHRLESLAIFRRLDLSVLIIDYRGYGQSEGKPSEAGLREDARAAWRHLREARGMPAEKIMLFGRSLGSAVASELAREHSPGALILESPFRSAPEMAQAAYPFLPARWLTRMDYDNEAHVQAVTAPTLVIHARDDEIIPIEQGRAVHAAAAGPKAFLELQGGHNTAFLEDRAKYVQGIDRFLKEKAGM